MPPHKAGLFSYDIYTFSVRADSAARQGTPRLPRQGRRRAGASALYPHRFHDRTKSSA